MHGLTFNSKKATLGYTIDRVFFAAWPLGRLAAWPLGRLAVVFQHSKLVLGGDLRGRMHYPRYRPHFSFATMDRLHSRIPFAYGLCRPKLKQRLRRPRSLACALGQRPGY